MVHIVDQSPGAPHLPMQSPVQTGLPTPPSSSRRASLQYSPVAKQASQLHAVGLPTTNPSAHLVNPPQYTSLDMQNSGQRVMVQRQGMPTGPGQSIHSTAIPRRSMPAAYPTVGGSGHPAYSPTQAGSSAGSLPAHYSLSTAAVSRQNEHYRHNAPPHPQQYTHGAPQNYQQPSGLRRQSYNQAEILSALPGNAPPSGSAPAQRPVAQRTVSYPTVVIPGHQAQGMPSPAIHPTPSTPSASQQSHTVPSSIVSSRPASAAHARSAPNSLPQSPVVHVSQQSQMPSAYLQYALAQVQGHPQPQAQPRPMQQAPHPHQVASHQRAQYAAQQRVPHQLHQVAPQSPLQPQAAPQQHAQQVQQAPPAQPQQQQQPQTQPQAQGQPRPNAQALLSRSAVSHAQSLLTVTASYLDYSYRTALYGVARELDKHGEQFTAICDANKRLIESSKQSEEERVLLRQDRTRLLEEVATLRQNGGASAANPTIERLLALCRGYEQTAQAQKAEMEKLKEENGKLRHLNNVVLQTAYTGPFAKNLAGEGAAIDPSDIVLMNIGPYVAPRGLVKVIEEAIKGPIVQHYEAQIAQVMAAARRERDGLTKQQSLLQALVRSEEEAAAMKVPGASSTSATASQVPSELHRESPDIRPLSTPLTLASSQIQRHTPETRAASQQPSSTTAPTNAQSIPSPPRTATPLDAAEEPVVKTEPTEPPTWPWAQGELIDLTLLDSPPPPPATIEFSEIASDALSAELDRELMALEQSAARREGGKAKEVEVDGAGESGEDGSRRERKRSLEDGAEEDSTEAGARKKMRVDGEDVEMEEGETEEGETVPCSPETEDGELKSLSQETVVLVGKTLPEPERGATSSGTETMSTESDSSVEGMLLDDQVALHQSPEPIKAILNLISQNTISPPASSAPVQLQSEPPQAIATLFGLPPLPTTLTTLLPHQPPAQIKNEPREPLLNPQTTPSKPKLGIRHIDLAYHTSKDKMTCRMCFKRAEVTAGWEVKRFPISAPWADLSRHCEQVHPAGYKSLIDLDPATLAETRERLLAMDGQKGRR